MEESSSIIQNQTITNDDMPAENKIEEIVKWKLEATSRKLNDRLQSCEARQHQLSTHMNSVAEECHSEFLQIKDLVV